MNGTPKAALAAGLVGATALLAPGPEDVAEFASWLVRPAVLPFAWQSLLEAEAGGDAAEVFARAQRLLQLMPGWTDGHAAFAFRYALADERAGDPAARAARARARLDVAMAWLASARPRAGRHELSLLQLLALLPDVAARQEPGLADLLRPSGGAEAMAAAWLTEAERCYPTAAVREQRTFFAPRLAAALLAAGDRAGARAVLATAIERSHDVRDQELAAEWRLRLQEVVRALAGEVVDLDAVAADPRLRPLLPFLR